MTTAVNQVLVIKTDRGFGSVFLKDRKSEESEQE